MIVIDDYQQYRSLLQISRDLYSHESSMSMEEVREVAKRLDAVIRSIEIVHIEDVVYD